jgi:hypothetical protein
MAAGLSPEEIRQISGQVAADQLAQRIEVSMPQPMPLTGWEKEAHESQERRRLERVAAAHAEEERQREALTAARERRRLEWEANAPTRAAAQAELSTVEQELERLEGERERLLDRERDLQAEAKR